MTVAPLLEVRDLTIVLPRGERSFVALDEASFSVAPGEVLGLVGESGAGKSLTGAAVVNLLSPPLRRSGGTITLAGERLDQLPPDGMRRVRGRKIGFIFQDPLTSLNPVFTVGRQLTDTILTHLPVSRQEAYRRAVGWIRRVGLPDPERRFDQYPHELSGGMRQRVVIALALCAEPCLVIADEPTTALDVSVQAHILNLLRDLHDETGVALLLITHDLGVIAKMADRVAVLYAGRIVEIGPVAEILNRPRHPYTRGLMNAMPPMHEHRGNLTPIPGAMPSLGAIPSGCPFHPRCRNADDYCTTHRPDLQGQGESAGAFACWHPIREEDPSCRIPSSSSSTT
jgi:peptide/nickel transport system ATP-binding protein